MCALWYNSHLAYNHTAQTNYLPLRGCQLSDLHSWHLWLHRSWTCSNGGNSRCLPLCPYSPDSHINDWGHEKPKAGSVISPPGICSLTDSQPIGKHRDNGKSEVHSTITPSLDPLPITRVTQCMAVYNPRNCSLTHGWSGTWLAVAECIETSLMFSISLIVLLLDCRWGTINRFHQLRGGKSLRFRDDDHGRSLTCVGSGLVEHIKTSQVSLLFLLPQHR